MGKTHTFKATVCDKFDGYKRACGSNVYFSFTVGKGLKCIDYYCNDLFFSWITTGEKEVFDGKRNSSGSVKRIVYFLSSPALLA